MKLNYIIAITAVILLIAGCAQGTVTQNKQDLSNTANLVTIKDFEFQPSTITIKAGSIVTWLNRDSASHKIKFPKSSSPDLKYGDSYDEQFDQVGTFEYICATHPSMKGKVVVE